MVSCKLLTAKLLATVETMVVIATEKRLVVEGWDAVAARANRASARHDSVKGCDRALAGESVCAAVYFDERVTESPNHHVTAIQAGSFLPVQPLYRCAGYVEPEHAYSRELFHVHDDPTV